MKLLKILALGVIAGRPSLALAPWKGKIPNSFPPPVPTRTKPTNSVTPAPFTVSNKCSRKFPRCEVNSCSSANRPTFPPPRSRPGTSISATSTAAASSKARPLAGAAALGANRLADVFSPRTTAFAGTKLQTVPSPLTTTGEQLTSFDDITHYNNFYEFGVDKGDPAKNAGGLPTRPWTVKSRRQSRQAPHLRHRRPAQAPAA